MPVSKIVSKYPDVSRATMYRHTKKKSFSETSEKWVGQQKPLNVTGGKLYDHCCAYLELR